MNIRQLLLLNAPISSQKMYGGEMNGVALLSCGRGAPVNQNRFSLLVCGPSISAPILGGEFSLDVIEAEHIRKILSHTDSF